MIRDPQFWEDEHDSPLLSRNLGYVSLETADECCERAKQWIDLLGVNEAAPVDADFKRLEAERGTEDAIRIFSRDAERTWVPKDDAVTQARTLVRQKAHISNLEMIWFETRDYHQGLGYIAAFLSLFLEREDIVRIGVNLHRSPKHSMGYFKGEPQAFVRDARVMMMLLEKQFPAVHAHLQKNGAVPEMFCVKWFVGLCVHVLPFRELVQYWDMYFTHGTHFVFKFALSYIKRFEKDILAAKSTSELMTILRCEEPAADWRICSLMANQEGVFQEILDDSLSIELPADIESMREEVGEKVAHDCERAKQRMKELAELDSDSDGICFSDEEDDE